MLFIIYIQVNMWWDIVDKLLHTSDTLFFVYLYIWTILVPKSCILYSFGLGCVLIQSTDTISGRCHSVQPPSVRVGDSNLEVLFLGEVRKFSFLWGGRVVLWGEGQKIFIFREWLPYLGGFIPFCTLWLNDANELVNKIGEQKN